MSKWILLAMLLTAPMGLAEEALPEGDAPAPVVAGWFPTRLHAFVWRNWSVVEPAKLASVVGARADQVTALADSMGLPAQPVVPPEMRQRGYATLIRRNWHLLPYEQLLDLLEMTPERLSFMLREEDFLWIKLGSRKPKCERLTYQEPDESARQRAAEIKKIVDTTFGDELGQTAEPRFEFVRRLGAETPSLSIPERAKNEPLRLVYSYVALYGDPLLNPDLNPYPDGLLQRLAACGINGVWLQGLLRDLAPGGEAFPEFGENHEQRLANLRKLVERAGKYGVQVFLYFNEPRAMPTPFFEKHPEMAGVQEGALTALCTSHPAVRKWMSDALAYVFKEVPGLGGVYTITASENLTSCASHGALSSCKTCAARTDSDIISEVVAAIEEGVHRGNPEAAVLVSDWGWKGHGDGREIIARLPKSAWLMSVSEWSLPIERGGVKSTVGEYSISSVGPGPRAIMEWEAARQAGLRTGTEIQFNNTCEIASIPYIPVMDLVAEHCSRLLSTATIDAMLIGWTMGGHPSPNLRLAAELNSNPTAGIAGVLDALAKERYGEAGAPHARKAWTTMSEAYRQYPFHISVVYASPVQVGPANPVYPEKTGYSATMWGIPYDDVNGWRGVYPPDVLAAQFEKVAQGWQPGIAELELAAEGAPAQWQEEARTDVRFGRAAAIHFQSVANQARYVVARDTLADPATPAEQRPVLQATMRAVLESEITLARQLYTLTREDSRIGFEPSCQYFYLPLDLVEKVVNCRWILGK